MLETEPPAITHLVSLLNTKEPSETPKSNPFQYEEVPEDTVALCQSFSSIFHTRRSNSRKYGKKSAIQASTQQKVPAKLRELVEWVMGDSKTELDLHDEKLFKYSFKLTKDVSLKSEPKSALGSDTSGGSIEIFVDVLQLAVLNCKGEALKKLLEKLAENPEDFKRVFEKNLVQIRASEEIWQKLKCEDTKIHHQNILQVASWYSDVCLKILLSYFERLRGHEDPKLPSKKVPPCRNLLHLAATNPSFDCLKLLYDYFDVNSDFEEDESGNTPLHYSVKYGSIETAFYILKNTNVDVIKKIINKRNKKGKTALFYAHDPQILYLLLWYGADPTVGTCKTKAHLLTHFLNKFPENASALLNYEITTNEKPVHEPTRLHVYNYRLFNCEEIDDTNDSKEQVTDQGRRSSLPRHEGIKIFSSFSKKTELLNNPLVESFLHLKWLRIKLVFQFNLLIYSLFLISASTLICGTSYMKHHDPCFKNITKDALNCTVVNETGSVHIREFTQMPKYTEVFLVGWKFHFFHFFLICTIIFNIAIAIRQIYRIINQRRKYFNQFENWLECGAIICVFFYVLFICRRAFSAISDVTTHNDIEHSFGAVAVFLAWMKMTLLLGRFPSIGIYSYMSTRVIRQLMQFFIVFVTTLIAFALAFNVLLPKAQIYENPITAFLGVIVMMIGEFGFQTTFTSDSVLEYGTEFSNIITQLLFVLFLFSVSITITNLIIGLTVNNIRELFKDAGTYRLCKTLLEIQEVDNLVVKTLLFKPIRNCTLTCKLVDYFKLLPRLMHKSKDNAYENIEICLKPESSTDSIANYGQSQHIEIYTYNSKTEEKGKKLKGMSLPIWVMKNTELALAMKEKVESELNTLLQGFELRMKEDKLPSPSTGPASKSDQHMLEKLDTLLKKCEDLSSKIDRFLSKDE